MKRNYELIKVGFIKKKVKNTSQRFNSRRIREVMRFEEVSKFMHVVTKLKRRLLYALEVITCLPLTAVISDC